MFFSFVRHGRKSSKGSFSPCFSRNPVFFGAKTALGIFFMTQHVSVSSLSCYYVIGHFWKKENQNFHSNIHKREKSDVEIISLFAFYCFPHRKNHPFFRIIRAFCDFLLFWIVASSKDKDVLHEYYGLSRTKFKRAFRLAYGPISIFRETTPDQAK